MERVPDLGKGIFEHEIRWLQALVESLASNSSRSKREIIANPMFLPMVEVLGGLANPERQVGNSQVRRKERFDGKRQLETQSGRNEV